jgi:urease accessory protein
MNRLFRIAVPAPLATLLPMVAQAHPGHEVHAGLMQGLLHPLTGWDHLFVLMALGVLAAMRGMRTTVFCGLLLIAALMGGAALGLRFPALPFVEPAILGTVLACAALLWMRQAIRANLLAALCVGFAFVHGMAHGQEAPTGDVSAYFAGFTLCAAAIYAASTLLALRWIRTARSAATLRHESHRREKS